MDSKKKSWIDAIEKGIETVQPLGGLPSPYKDRLKAKLLLNLDIEVRLKRVWPLMAAASFTLLLMSNIYAYRVTSAMSSPSPSDNYQLVVNYYQIITPTLGPNNGL